MDNDNRLEPEPLMTVREVAAILRTDPKTVGRWVAAGKLDGFRTPGGQWRFRESVVRALLNGQPS